MHGFPTCVPDLVQAVLDLLIDQERGIRHLANEGAVTWQGFAASVASQLGADDSWSGRFGWRDIWQSAASAG